MFYKISPTRNVILVQLSLSIFTSFYFATCFALENSQHSGKKFTSEKAERIFFEGKINFSAENYERSIQEFGEVLEEDKNNYLAAYYLALSISKNLLKSQELSEKHFSKGWDAFNLASRNAAYSNLKDEKLFYAMSWYAFMEYLTVGREMTIEKRSMLAEKIRAFAQDAIKINSKFSSSYNILGAIEQLSESADKAILQYSSGAILGNPKSQENFYKLSNFFGNIYFGEAESSIESLRGRVYSQWADSPWSEILFGIQYWNSSPPATTGNPPGRASDDQIQTLPDPPVSCCAWGYQGGAEKNYPYSGWYTPQTTVRLTVKNKELMKQIIRAAQDLVAIEVELDGRTITGFKVLNKY